MSDELRKIAFVRGAMRAMGRLGGRVGGALGGTTGRRVGRNIGVQMGQQAAVGALGGGLIYGGLGALQAGEGNRLKGFAEGAASGATTGGLGGLAAGVVTAPMRGMRTNLMRAQGATPAQAAQNMRNSWFTNVKHTVTGGGPGGRGLAAVEAFGAPATVLAEGYAADKALGAVGLMPGAADETPNRTPQPHPQAPGQVRTASAYDDDSFRVEPLYVTPLIGAGVKSTVEPALESFAQRNPHHFLSNSPKIRKYMLPTAATMALMVPTVKGIRALNPAPADVTLKELDLDALKQDYGKRDAQPLEKAVLPSDIQPR